MFVGDFDKVIPLDVQECKAHLEMLKASLATKQTTYTNYEIVLLKTIETMMEESRTTDGREIGIMRKSMKPGRKYFIINIDEPYAEEIYQVLKKGQIEKNEWPEGDISFEEWKRQTFGLEDCLNHARNGIDRISKVCEAVLKLKDRDFAEVEKMCEDQENYCHPLKHATVSRQQELGKHNRKVIGVLKILRDTIKEGAAI